MKSDTLYQLLRPLAFLDVKGPTLNMYRYHIPFGIVFVQFIIFILSDISLKVVGDRSLADYMSSFFVSLPGFYIAALSAIVAFNGGDLDKEMSDVSATLMSNGDVSRQEISMRIFLCYLFCYLTIISFAGFFICLAGNLFIVDCNHSTLTQKIFCDPTLRCILSFSYSAVIVFLAASIVSCTVQSLYFLSERVNQSM
ncbi:MAG: hypothetical protein JWS11_959 [Cypionkella sp.]|nr:hypothetical protein [Cypionkella sp.]